MENTIIERFGRNPEHPGMKLAAMLAATEKEREDLGDERFFIALFIAEGKHVKDYGRPITGAKWVVRHGVPALGDVPPPAPDDPEYYLSVSDLVAFRVVAALPSLHDELAQNTAWNAMTEHGVLNYLDFVPDDATELREDFAWLSTHVAM